MLAVSCLRAHDYMCCDVFFPAGMTVFGGCSPLIMTAIQTGTGSIFLGPGIWMTGEYAQLLAAWPASLRNVF
jgi:hypothetical protein